MFVCIYSSHTPPFIPAIYLHLFLALTVHPSPPRLENHSTEASCMLYWTIIKPVEIQGGGGTASSEGNMARKEIEA